MSKMMRKLADQGHWGFLGVFMDYEQDPATLCEFLVHPNAGVRMVAKRQFERLMEREEKARGRK